MINFGNGSRMLAKLVPYIMTFFGGTRDIASKESSHAIFAPETSRSVWGRSGMNYYEIQRARRKAHRGKMYRRYRHQATRSMKAKVRS
jgi:hypothetical protein